MPHLILGLVLPVFTFYWAQQDLENFQSSLQKVFNLFIVLTLPMVAIFTAEAPGIINFIAGPEYGASVLILKILIWPTALIFFSSFFNYGIIALAKQKKTIKYFLITALVSLIGYLFLIPRFSYYGAAYMTLGAELLITLFSGYLLVKYSGWKIDWSMLKKVGFISIITYLGLSVLNLNFGVELILGVIFCFVLMILFKVLSRDLIREVLGNRR